LGSDVTITGVATLAGAGTGDLSFVVERKWIPQRKQAAALITTPDLTEYLKEMPLLISATPAVDAAKAAIWMGKRAMMAVTGIHPSAYVDESAELGPGVGIGPQAVIGAEVSIGAETQIHAGAVIHDRSQIGARCVIQSNTVIGADGYGYEYSNGVHHKIPHLGIVRIEDDVEIGANTTIDRARFDETVVGAGTKIDNLVQIGHNVVIGRGCLIISQVGIAGSCRIEDGAIIAGQAGLVPHVIVGKGARVVPGTGISKDIPPGATWSGWWGQDHRKNMLELNALRNLPEFMKQVRAFMKQYG
jgi:UDP-3-O-[3-hydroxymyristoyl] glucosamine N-acyltransferase